MAFDWIESHRGLKDHPKTVLLTAAWSDRKPCVLGHLHELWWWTLEYAPDGIIRPSFVPQVIAACEWHGKSDRFWSGLLESGFLEVQTDGSYAVHDWDEYAARRLARLEKDALRKRDVRAKRSGQSGAKAPDNGQMSGAMSADSSCARARAPVPPDQPTGREASVPDQPSTPLPTSDADAQGGSAPRVGSPRENGTNPRALGTNPRALGTNPRAADDEPAVIHADAGVCPLCRLPYTGPYLEHTAQKHRVHPEPGPGNLGPALGRRRRHRDKAEAPPPEVEAQFAAMHQRLQSVPEQQAQA
jgi:hypothetical protein